MKVAVWEIQAVGGFFLLSLSSSLLRPRPAQNVKGKGGFSFLSFPSGKMCVYYASEEVRGGRGRGRE